MLSALAWVPRGAAKETPEVYMPDAEDKELADEQASEREAERARQEAYVC